uniref:Uncharacterized protein n=1 Tax=Anguilla anguilla TaxID=7936 RepID=A0A0E9VTE6_ANGAN
MKNHCLFTFIYCSTPPESSELKTTLQQGILTSTKRTDPPQEWI